MKKIKSTIRCKCPFCDKELIMQCFEADFCAPCKTKFIICVECNQRYNEKLKKCPKCGEKHGN